MTFDFDAMSVRIGSCKSVNPSEISRGEFGAVAIPRILDLLDRHDIPGTFCIPGHTACACPDLVKRLHDGGHEIAHLGRSPAWDFSDNTTEILKEFGFLYDSSLMGDDDTPYYMRSGDQAPADAPYVFGRHIDIVEPPVTWMLDDFPYFERDSSGGGLKSASHVEEIWRDEFTRACNNVDGGICNLTMHPQVIGRGHRLMMLDRLVSHVAQHPGVVFDTLGD